MSLMVRSLFFFSLGDNWIDSNVDVQGEHPAAMQRGNRSPSTNGGERAAHLGAKCFWAIQVIALQYSIQRWMFGSSSPNV